MEITWKNINSIYEGQNIQQGRYTSLEISFRYLSRFLLFYVLSMYFLSRLPRFFHVHKRRALKRMCANTKSISPYFYIMPAVHKNRYKLIRYIKLLHIHDHYSYRSRNSSKRYKEIGTRTLMVLLKRVVHDGKVKTDHLLPPIKFKNARDPFIQSSKSIEMWILLVWGAEKTKCLGVSLFAEGRREERATEQQQTICRTYGRDKTKCELW